MEEEVHLSFVMSRMTNDKCFSLVFLKWKSTRRADGPAEAEGDRSREQAEEDLPQSGVEFVATGQRRNTRADPEHGQS
jgi:hypothetical protein